MYEEFLYMFFNMFFNISVKLLLTYKLHDINACSALKSCLKLLKKSNIFQQVLIKKLRKCKSLSLSNINQSISPNHK
jgi:hypothetical protein